MNYSWAPRPGQSSNECVKLLNASLLFTADGTAGGTHILLSAAVSGGALNIFKVQILDKRWVRGADRDGKGAFNSFTVV